MKIKLLVAAAILSVPAAAFAQEAEAACCCENRDAAAEGCCPEGEHAGHGEDHAEGAMPGHS